MSRRKKFAGHVGRMRGQFQTDQQFKEELFVPNRADKRRKAALARRACATCDGTGKVSRLVYIQFGLPDPGPRSHTCPACMADVMLARLKALG